MTTLTVAETHSEVMRALERYVQKVAASGVPQNLKPDTPLLGAGLLDSLSIVELTMHLSEKFHIEFDDDDFATENFMTAGSLAALVASKSTRAA